MAYTVKEVARLLEVHRKDVRRWIETGKLICEIDRIEQGRCVYRITDDNLIEFFVSYPEYFPLAEIFTRKCDITKIKEELVWLSHTGSTTP